MFVFAGIQFDLVRSADVRFPLRHRTWRGHIKLTKTNISYFTLIPHWPISIHIGFTPEIRLLLLHSRTVLSSHLFVYTAYAVLAPPYVTSRRYMCWLFLPVLGHVLIGYLCCSLDYYSTSTGKCDRIDALRVLRWVGQTHRAYLVYRSQHPSSHDARESIVRT